MPIRSVDVSTGVTSLRAATASATTFKQSQSQRPPVSPTEASKVTTTTAVAVPATQAAPTPAKAAQSESQMRFHVDQDTGKTVVALVDPENGEVLRQFPTAEALEVAKEIGRFQGMFVNLKV